ncbi:MAG: DUF4292 domain-containing protein [Balneolaceae bacterium]
MKRPYFLYPFFWLGFLLLLAGCGSSGVAVGDLQPATISHSELLERMPNYDGALETVDGSGRALVSEPGSSERVTVEFRSTRDTSLLTIRNSVGISGGQILVEDDSLLIYNAVDRVAQKVSVAQSTLSSVGSIASLNLINLLNFTVTPEEIQTVFEDGSDFVLLLRNEAVVRVGGNGLVKEVIHAPENRRAPYRRIEYEGYAQIEGFQLPRKITILSRDGQSRAVFLVQNLGVNGSLPPLTITIPESVPIQRPS